MKTMIVVIKNFLIVIIATTVLLVGIVLYKKEVQAVPGFPFGGPRINTQLCTCLVSEIPGTVAITIIDYTNGAARPFSLKFIPGISRPYPYFNIFASVYVLGDYFINPTPCMIQAGKICIPNPAVIPPVAGTVNYMGTSQ